MSLPTFWHTGAGAGSVGATVNLTGAEGHHAQAVRRVRPGEAVCVTDGEGVRLTGTVTAVPKGAVSVRVDDVAREAPPTPRLTVVQAVPKGERAEQAVSMLTEVGVDVIVPWNAQRCQQRITGDRVAKQLAKWRSWAFEAAKQSRRAWFPQVRDPMSTTQVTDLLAATAAGAGLVLVLHESARRRLSSALHEARSSRLPTDVVLVVGPEGGLTDDELTTFGTSPVLIGDTVLRTSTAGVVAAGVVRALA